MKMDRYPFVHINMEEQAPLTLHRIREAHRFQSLGKLWAGTIKKTELES